jgi:hypothetical protein
VSILPHKPYAPLKTRKNRTPLGSPRRNTMNELEKMEKHAEVLMRHIEINSKKIRQAKLKDHIWDMRRLEATLRTIHELRDLALMINELWEHPDRETILGS